MGQRPRISRIIETILTTSVSHHLLLRAWGAVPGGCCSQLPTTLCSAALSKASEEQPLGRPAGCQPPDQEHDQRGRSTQGLQLHLQLGRVEGMQQFDQGPCVPDLHGATWKSSVPRWKKAPSVQDCLFSARVVRAHVWCVCFHFHLREHPDSLHTYEIWSGLTPSLQSF